MTEPVVPRLAATLSELSDLREWLRNGNAYMEHPDGQEGTDNAVDALDFIIDELRARPALPAPEPPENQNRQELAELCRGTAESLVRIAEILGALGVRDPSPPEPLNEGEIEERSGFKCPQCGRQSLYRNITAMCANERCDYVGGVRGSGVVPSAPSPEAITAFVNRASPCGLPRFLMAQWDEQAAKEYWGNGYGWANQTQEGYMRARVSEFLQAAYAVEFGGRGVDQGGVAPPPEEQ